jgi:signal transduction histidine kinase/ActR/RegA family two-component response regulator
MENAAADRTRARRQQEKRAARMVMMAKRVVDDADTPHRARGAALPITVLPFPVIRLDSTGRVLSSNGVLERELALPPDALRGRRLVEVIDADSRARMNALAASPPTHDALIELSFTGTAAVKHRTFHLVRRRGAVWLIGQPAELEEAISTKARFLTTMSHELRTPLNAVLGYAGLLRDGVYGTVSAQQERAVQAIVRRAKDLQTLIGDVLDLSNIEAGRLELHTDDFDPARVIAEIAREMAPAARERELSVIVHDRLRGHVRLDRGKYKRAVMTLVSNAMKFTPRRGEIDITVSEESATHFTTRVRDTGIGIDKDQLPHIFETFELGDAGTTRRFGGLGIGLTLAQRTVELLGGRIQVESAPGAGATFVITLPMHAEQDPLAAALEEPPADQSPAGPLMLAIDDDPEVIGLLRDSLVPAGYRVVGALNGDRGIELARILQPFAITLDVMMPVKDGWQVLRELKADPAVRDIPVIMMSIVAERAAGFSLGATDYLVKPVDRQVLVGILDRLRRRHRTEQRAAKGRRHPEGPGVDMRG